MEDFEIIIESLKGELKAKSNRKTFTPDSGHQAGGGRDTKNMTADELIDAGLKQKKKKTGG